jgi:hypothetical protein
MRSMCALLAGVVFSTPLLALAGNGSPVGLWKTIDDATGQPTAFIRIADVNGELQGKIEKLVQPADQSANPLTDKCQGDNRNNPKIGMTILSG